MFFQQSNIESRKHTKATAPKLNQNIFPWTMHIFFNFWRLVRGLSTAPWKLNDRLNGDMTLPRCMRNADRAKRLCGEIPGGDKKSHQVKRQFFRKWGNVFEDIGKQKIFCQKCRAARHRFSKHWIWVHQILFACKWHCISKQRVWVHTPQTHLLGGRFPRPPKTPKRKDGNYRKKNREN